MKILITGASGFVGSKVLDRLKLIYGTESIIALSSRSIEGVKTVDSHNYKFGRNYLEESGCGDVKVLIHIGAFIPKAAKDVDNMELTTENIENTQRLLQSRMEQLEKIIFISTVDVYARCQDALDETKLTVPSTLYGWSKLYCEEMVKKYCIEKKCSYEILRLGHVYGEGEEKYKKAMPSMINNAVMGKDLNIYGDGKAVRTFVYVDDVAKAIVNAINLYESETINVVGNETVTIEELAKMIQSFADRQINIIHTPADVSNVNYVFDNSKMRMHLIQSFTPLEAGLKREYDYMKEKLGL